MFGWLKALAALFGFAQKVAEEVHDHNERVAGETTVVAADLKKENEANAKVLAAAVGVAGKPVADSLRDGTF